MPFRTFAALRKMFARFSATQKVRRRKVRFFKRGEFFEGLEDRQLLSTFTVTNTLDNTNAGSLRWAIGQANSNAGADTINFDSTVFSTAQTITLGGTQLELSDTTGATTITGSAAGVTISGNNVSRVFAINANASATISSLTITGGKSTVGGGVYNAGEVTINNSTLSGNTAGNGGGVANYGAVMLTNCTISGNTVTNGGGIFNRGTASLTSCTITRNLATSTGGGIDGNGTTSTVYISNTIVAKNQGGQYGSDVAGPVRSQGYNLSGETDASYGWVATDLIGTAQYPVDPKLGALAWNDGPTQTMALLAGSPAINAGTSTEAPATDQRGYGRLGAYDIGAYEYGSTRRTITTTRASSFNPSKIGQSVTFTATLAGFNPNPTGTVTFKDGSSTLGTGTWSNGSVTLTTSLSAGSHNISAMYSGDSDHDASTSLILTQLVGLPDITTQPSSVTVNGVGDTATFTAAAIGAPDPTVKWQVSTNSGSTWTDISGATSTSYTTPTLTKAYNGYQYRAVFTNSVGTATSSAATLVVPFVPTITTQPTSQSLLEGSTASFTAASDASPTAAVQWQISTNGTTWTDIGGATNLTYSLTTTLNDSGKQYRAVFTTLLGSATTNAATLTVGVAPVVTTQPSSVTVNGSGQTATFTAAATGSPTPSVQWQVTKPTATSGTFLGKDTTTLGTWKGVYGEDGYYIANDSFQKPSYANVSFVNNGEYTWNGSTTDSRALQKGAVGSTDRLASCYYTYGNLFSSDSNFTIHVDFTDGQTHKLSLYALDWDSFGRSNKFEVFNSANNQLLDTQSLPSYTGGSWFSWWLSGSVDIKVTTLTQGATVSGVFFDTFTNIPGATSTTYTTPALNGSNDGYKYRAVFTNSWGVTNSSLATLTLAYAPSIITQPASTSAFTGATASFTAASDFPTTATVQWQSSSSGTTWTNITNATSSTYSFTATPGDSGKQYRAVFTNAGGSTTTNAATFTLVTLPAVTTQPANTGTYAGGTATFTAAASGAPTPTVQWQKATKPSSNISYLGKDTTTLGTWKGVYGAEGYYIANDSFQKPSYANVSFVNNLLWTWNDSTTDTRALQKGATGSTDRLASCYYSDSNFTIHVDFTDGQTHKLSLYVLDWDSIGRSNKFQVFNSANNQLLDTQSLPSYTGGAWLSWVLKGSVDIKVTTLTQSATISGVFFDSATTFTNIPGATSTTYTTPAVSLADNGNQYRAVFTNVGGFVSTNAAALTVDPNGYSANGTTLNLQVSTTNTSVTSTALGSSYTFALNTSTWAGSAPGVTNSNGTLTVDAATYSTINVTTVGTGDSYTFANSGSNKYSSSINVSMANTNNVVTFMGSNAFTGSNGLSVTDSGAIAFQGGASLKTVDGSISLVGNLSGVTTGNNIGVNVNNSTIQATGSGSIVLNGTGSADGANSNTLNGIFLNSSVVNTNTGNISITGKGGGSNGNTGYDKGMNIVNSQVTSSGGGAVTLVGTGNAFGSSGYNSGVAIGGTSKVSSAGGPVSVTGQGAGPNGSNYGVWVVDTASISATAGGSITVVGTGGGSGGAQSNIGIFQESSGASISAAGSGTVSLTGRGGASSGSWDDGVTLRGTVSTVDGALTITGTGVGSGAATDVRGVVVHAGAQVGATGSGNVTVTGQGGNTTGHWNLGVYVTDANTRVFSNSGALNVTGIGGGGGTSQGGYGVGVQSGAQILSTGAGNVNVVGTGGTGTGGINWGVVVVHANSTIKSTGGNVTVTGKEGVGSTSYGFRLGALSTVSAPAGSISLNIDSLESDGTGVMTTNATTGTISLAQYTNGVGINLGSSSTANGGPLPIDNAKLGRMTAGTITLGNANSGAVSVSAAVTSPSNLVVAAAGGITPSGTTQVTATGKTLSFQSGSALNIGISGTTLGSGYNQLNVAGTVNLTNADLKLTGSYKAANGTVFTIVSATSRTGTFNNLPEGASFAYNGLGYRVNYTATSATLTVVASVAPSITTQPVGTTVNAGDTATFTAAASGTPTPTVQWQSSTNGTDWSDINGASSTTYSFTTVAGDNARQYRAVFTNSVGSVTTSAATLTVNSAPAVITQPASTTVVAGATATFTAAASGTPTPTVQWQSSPNGTTWNDIGSATSSSYSFTAAAGDSGKQYRAVFTNSVGSATTSAATLTVNAAPAITSQPASTTVVAGATATFTAAATGTPAPTVQWQSSPNGLNWSDIGGATNASYSFTTAAGDNARHFRAVFTNVVGTVTTTAATLTVNTAPFITHSPTSKSVIEGETVEFMAVATGAPTPTVQWQKSTNSGLSWVDINGATSTTYSFTSTLADDGVQYHAVFSNGIGSPATTNVATLSVQSAGYTVTTEPTDQTVNAGATASFTAVADGTPTPNVQWQVSTDKGETWTNIDGATSTTYSFTTAAGDNGKQFQAVFTGSSGTAVSTLATLTVNYAPSVTSNPADDTVESGSTAEFIASCDANPTASVQWQVKSGSGSWTDIAGATSNIYRFIASNADNGSMYQAVFTNTLGTLTSTAATLTVTYAPSITTEPSSTTVNAGDVITLTAASDASPTASVQWQVSTDDCVTWSDLQGATSVTYSFTASAADNGKCYQAIFTNSEGEAITTAAVVTVNDAPSVVTNPVTQAVTVGSTVEFTAAATGNPAPSVQWQVKSGAGSWTNIVGATGTTYSLTTTSGDTGSQYRAVFTNSVGTARTTAATLTVGTAPVVTSSPADTAANAGQTATFTASCTGSPAPTVQWQSKTGAGTWTSINGATSTSYTTGVLSASDTGTQYRAVFTNVLGTQTTQAATLSVNYLSVTSQPSSLTVNAPASASFTAIVVGNPAPSIQWQKSTNGGSTWSNIAGAIDESYTISTTAGTDNGSQFRAVVSNAAGTITTNVATLTVRYAPVVTSNPASTAVNAGQTATFTAAANANPAPTVQWQTSTNGGTTWTNITGATGVSYTTGVLTTANGGTQYRASFVNSVGSALSSVAVLGVNQAPTITSQPASVTANTGTTATFTAAATGIPAPTVQWQVSTNSGTTWSNINGATGTSYSVVATGNTGSQYRAVFTNTVGTVTSNAATLTIATVAQVTGTSMGWGTQTANLMTNADGLRLLPVGRVNTIPWLGVNKITLTLDNPIASLAAGDISFKSAANLSYSVQSISGSGTSWTITLANNGMVSPDKLTVTVANSSLASFTRRLDVLPGDVNDDGMVSSLDMNLVQKQLTLGYVAFFDVDGTGTITTADVTAVKARIGNKLPA